MTSEPAGAPSDRSGLVFQLVDEFGHAPDLDAGLALRRLRGLHDLDPRLEVMKTAEPPGRKSGVKVASPAELVGKLKDAGAI